MEQTDTIEFLELLDPESQKFLFACFDYRKKQKPRQFYGSFSTIKPKLLECNEDNYCVYICVNETEGASRKLSKITRARAIWVEDDDEHDEPRSDWPLEPSIIVESSPKKYHYYWLTSTKNLDEWDMVMNTMVQEYGCDKNARDVARVMRLPGFKHRKNLDADITCRIHSVNERVYRWFEIKAVFKPIEKKRSKAQSDNPSSPSEYSESEAIKALLSSENYHGSLTSISMSMSNKGISRDLQHATLFGLMHKIPKNKRRPEWEDRISDEHLYECIDSAIRKVEGEEDEELVDVGQLKAMETVLGNSKVDFPPGKMGNLCEEILEMAPYPNKEIALASAMGLVAGITGRTYNVSGMGLNLYITILADSGIGKANLKDSINLALRTGNKMNMGSAFIGGSRFTGPKAVFDMLTDGLSRICVLEEAGLLSEGAGDTQGLTRVYLDLFTSSGYGKYGGGELYSSKDNHIPVLHSPALSVVNVSTPRSFLKALKDKSADVSGEVARLWMMRSIGEKPYFNKDRRKDYSKETIAVLGKLIATCIPHQAFDSELKTIDIEIPDEFIEQSDHWVDLENKYIREENHLKRTLCSRAWAKILKMAAVVSVYNGKIEIGEDEYWWAHSCVTRELNTIEESFTYEGNDQLSILAENLVAPAIIKALKGEFKDGKKVPNNKMRDKGMITKYNLSQILKHNRVLNEINDDVSKNNPKTGLDKVLNHMVGHGLLAYVDDIGDKVWGARAKTVYKITREFYIMYTD